MKTVKDYVSDVMNLLKLTFSTGGNTPLDFNITEVYEEDNWRMVRLRGLQGDAQFPLGSVRLDDILDCPRVYN